MKLALQTISRVTRTKVQAKRSYDKISSFYDLLAGVFEQHYREIALSRLQITAGETVLEVGFGTGHSLKRMAEAVGNEGKVYGIDISTGMLQASKHRLEKAGLWDRVELISDDAMKMPYPDQRFDAVFSSFAIELFDSPEIPKVLAEIRRVLKPGGRVGIVSMSKEGGASSLLRLYEQLHEKLPQFVDCRPIYVKQSLGNAGFAIRLEERVSLLGLPGEIVVGVRLS